MRRVFVKASIAGITFCIGVAGSMLAKRIRVASTNKSSFHAIASQRAKHASRLSHGSSSAQPRLESLSPYRIKVFINGNQQASLKDVWQKLGIPAALGRTPGLLNTCQGCEAETYEYDLDNEPGKEVLLRVADNLQEACRYLVFKPVEPLGGEEWKLLGYFDHDFGRYKMPQHFYLLSGGKSWLLIQTQECSGSGVSLYHDRVFTVDRSGLKEVLSYPSEGHQSGMANETTRGFSARIIGYENRKSVPSLEIEFRVTYVVHVINSTAVISSKTQRATFVQRHNSSKYRLDPAQSDLSRNEIESVYNIDSLSNEDFLKYNYPDLIKIARGNEMAKKEWLGGFLDQCKNFSQKTSLRKALKNNS